MQSLKHLKRFDIFLIIIFILWMISVSFDFSYIQNFDNFFISQIYHDHFGFPMTFLTVITNIGGTFWTIIITILIVIILVYFKYYYAALFLVANKLIVVTLNSIIKDLIQRPRPSHHHFVYESSFSFPSGHASSALSLYIPLLLIGIFIFKKIGSQIIISTLAILMVLAIGYSRIYLGVHYPSDIIGGYLLAGVVLVSTIIFFRSKNIFVLDLKGIQKQS